jgi:hypothetical protein
LQVDISEAGFINERHNAATMMEDLKEIFSQKQIGGFATETDDYRKNYDTSSNSSGSKSNPTSVIRTQKIASF